MPRLNQIELDSAEGKAKELLEGINTKLQTVPNIFKAMVNSPATTEFYLKSGEILAGGELTPKEREAIALIIAETNKCKYCSAAHTAIGVGVGIDGEEAIQIRKNQSPDQKLSALVNFAKITMDKKGFVSNEDIENLKTAGYNDAQITEAVAVVAINVFTNFFNHVNDSEVDFPQVAEI